MKKVNVIKMVVAAALVSAVAVRAEEAKEAAGKKKHMVDMADGMSSAEFYDAKNPDAIWSSELKMPWAKTNAINAYETDNNKRGAAINAYETDQKSSASKGGEAEEKPAVVGASSAAESSLQEKTPSTSTSARPAVAVGKVNGQEVDGEQLINIRVLYTLDAERSRASYSPVSAQNELYRQMSGVCSQGFQKVAEWSEPVEASDYYLYYQFKCIDKR